MILDSCAIKRCQKNIRLCIFYLYGLWSNPTNDGRQNTKEQRLIFEVVATEVWQEIVNFVDCWQSVGFVGRVPLS